MSFFIYKEQKVFYSDKGSGEPLIIIHGNTVSSKMHFFLSRKLKKHLRVISIDLPGHGKSERVEKWPVDFWHENSRVVSALIKHLCLEKSILLGYSGGAQIALNVALENPELVSKAIADSFEGEHSVASYAENIFDDRNTDKKKSMAKIFWFLMHGLDWKTIVDKDSETTYAHHQQIGSFFHKDLSRITIPVLLTGSKHDEYIHNFEDIYIPISKKIAKAEIKLYDSGSHPASLTAGKEYINDLLEFIHSHKIY